MEGSELSAKAEGADSRFSIDVLSVRMTFRSDLVEGVRSQPPRTYCGSGVNGVCPPNAGFGSVSEFARTSMSQVLLGNADGLVWTYRSKGSPGEATKLSRIRRRFEGRATSIAIVTLQGMRARSFDGSWKQPLASVSAPTNTKGPP